MTVLLALLLLDFGWNAHQQRQINALPNVVDRLEHAVNRLDGLNITATGGHASVYMRTPLTPEELRHVERERALHAVWLANYGQEIADAMLHNFRTRPAPGQQGSGAGGP